MASLPTKSGVYKIVNTQNNKCYIGSAVNLRKRKNEHFAHLKRGIHHSVYLQRSYNKYGMSAFRFDIIAYTLPALCIRLEQAALDMYSPEYNMATKAGSRLGAPQPKSMCDAQSKRMKERWATLPKQERLELSRRVSVGIKGYWDNKPLEVIIANAKKASDAAKEQWESLSQKEMDERTRKRTTLASHVRWHKNRGLISPTCPLCKEV